MGQEITKRHFSKKDFIRFQENLELETQLVAGWFQQKKFYSHQLQAGYELEACLIDQHARPYPCNQSFLKLANSPLLTSELAQFNVELNSEPVAIQTNFLSLLQQDFQKHWTYCQQQAEKISARILSIGILPSLTEQDLTLTNISPLQRYHALNEQILKHRNGEAFHLNINGHQSIKRDYKNVMLEAATTSLQIHLQVPQEKAVRYYNAAMIISAPMVAISANSAILFAKDIWSESRIPLFEQSVNVGGFNGAAHGPIQRVSFGTAYARHSLMECFHENKEHFPILLPTHFTHDPSTLKHLNLHNGTIWRWNRPLIGFNDDGSPHLRIEHRVMASGPSIIDNVANMAFFYGLIHYYANREIPAESQLDFSITRDNFYTAAQHGLHTKINWPDCDRCNIRHLILNRLLDEAQMGLNALKLNPVDIDFYLNIIQSRAEGQQTGSDWQRAFIKQHGMNMQNLTESYYYNQQLGNAVHQWDLNKHSSGLNYA